MFKFCYSALLSRIYVWSYRDVEQQILDLMNITDLFYTTISHRPTADISKSVFFELSKCHISLAISPACLADKYNFSTIWCFKNTIETEPFYIAVITANTAALTSNRRLITFIRRAFSDRIWPSARSFPFRHVLSVIKRIRFHVIALKCTDQYPSSIDFIG